MLHSTWYLLLAIWTHRFATATGQLLPLNISIEQNFTSVSSGVSYDSPSNDVSPLSVAVMFGFQMQIQGIGHEELQAQYERVLHLYTKGALLCSLIRKSSSSRWRLIILAPQPRQPGFKEVVIRGYGIAQAASRRPDRVPIQKIRNAIPDLQPSVKLDGFIHLELMIIVTLPNDPYYVASLRSDPQRWNSWVDAFYPGVRQVPKEIASLGFYPEDITMDEDAALANLAQRRIRGIWNVVQLCVLRETRRLAYAFTNLVDQPYGPELVSSWRMVDVLTGRVWRYVGDPCFDHAVRTGDSASSSASNRTDPQRVLS